MATTQKIDGQPIKLEPDRYGSAEYLNPIRFLGLREQLILVNDLKPRSVLEIGPGPGLLTAILRTEGISVTTVDYDRRLSPDVVSSATQMGIAAGTHDVVCAFQVLEHLPLDHLSAALREMGRVAKRDVVFSVPDHAGLMKTRLGIELTLLGRRAAWTLRTRQFKALSNPTEHFWEIGCRGVNSDTVKSIAQQAGLVCVRDYLPCAYFHFFHCRLPKKET